MKYTRSSSAFTLIEILVSVTIFSIIMVSVLSVFLFSSQMSKRIEADRILQENIKNVFEDIAEQVRKGRIEGATDTSASCGGVPSTGTKLCLGDSNYMIGRQNTSGIWVRVDSMDECRDSSEDDQSICRVIKNVGGADYYPLTNSFVAVEHLEFWVSNDDLPKVTVSLTLRPAYGKGLQAQLVESSKISVQTTISERLIETD